MEFKLQDLTMRLATLNDIDNYYKNFNPLDSEIAKFTGSNTTFTREQIESFYTSCLDDDSRYDFLVVDKQNEVIAEAVLNDIDTDVNSANFRIAIFNQDNINKGLGSWMIHNILTFGFEELALNRIELDVFSFNKRAIKAYEKAGFKHEGILREAVISDGQYYDDVLMAILRSDWDNQKKKSEN